MLTDLKYLLHSSIHLLFLVSTFTFHNFKDKPLKKSQSKKHSFIYSFWDFHELNAKFKWLQRDSTWQKHIVSVNTKFSLLDNTILTFTCRFCFHFWRQRAYTKKSEEKQILSKLKRQKYAHLIILNLDKNVLIFHSKPILIMAETHWGGKSFYKSKRWQKFSFAWDLRITGQ